MLGFLAACSVLSSAFYLPGVNPREYQDGDLVTLKVNKLSSPRTHLPYDFYSLPFCPAPSLTHQHENLGEMLSGDEIHNSPYEIRMNEEVTCRLLCSMEYTKKDMRHFYTMVKEEYFVNWLVDNLPAVWTSDDPVVWDEDGDGEHRGPSIRSGSGFPLGMRQKIDGKWHYFIHNHVRIELDYHSDSSFEGKRVVGFRVTPYSIEHELDGDGKLNGCNFNSPTHQTTEDADKVVWTYDVVWRPSPVKWASRWDAYLNGVNPQVHWLAILNSIVVVLCLSGFVAMILNRALHNDIDRYNRDAELEDEVFDDWGWKSLYADVFRPPEHAGLLAVCCGIGAQILAMILLTMLFALLGLLSPANRGALMTAMVFWFAFMGLFAGYVSARLYKSMSGKAWKATTLRTAFAFPGVAFFVFFGLNLLLHRVKSSGAVSFTAMFELLLLWVGVSVPLVLFGAWRGYMAPTITFPVTPIMMPRENLPRSFVSRWLPVMFGGLVPFGVGFIEIFLIMSSIWLNQYYYAFFFLFAVFAVTLVACAEISIVLSYFQLCQQDHCWWWRAFLAPASCGIYLFLYSVYYLLKIHLLRPVSCVLFLGYMLLVCLAVALATGFAGFMASFFFVRAIYSAIKVN